MGTFFHFHLTSCLTDEQVWLILKLLLSLYMDTKRSFGKQALTGQTLHTCLTWYARVVKTTGTAWRFQTEVELIVAHRCSKFIACFAVETIQSWHFPLCRATVTLHQGQGQQNDHEYIYPTSRCTYMPSSNAIAEMFSEILLNRAASLIPLFYISSLALLPRPVASSVLSLSAFGPFSWSVCP